MNRQRSIEFVMVLLMMGGIFWFQYQRTERAHTVQQLYEAAADELDYSNDSLSASIRVLQAATKRQFLQLQSKDSSIIALQQAVKRYKGKLASATVASTVTSVSGSSETTVTPTDTVVIDSVVYVYPTYSTSWTDKWSSGTITATIDSISRVFKVTNDYTFTYGYGRWNPFKKRDLTVTMTNLNPNTTTTELRTFTVKQSEKRFGLALYAGYGMTATVNGELYHGFQVGGGVIWRIWP